MAAVARLEKVNTLVTVGVDTHAEAHVAVALNQTGSRLGTLTVPTTGTGY
jgi:hypothetical protein